MDRDKLYQIIKQGDIEDRLERLGTTVINKKWWYHADDDYNIFYKNYEWVDLLVEEHELNLGVWAYRTPIIPTESVTLVYRLTKDQIGIFVAVIGKNTNGDYYTVSMSNYSMMLDEPLYLEVAA